MKLVARRSALAVVVCIAAACQGKGPTPGQEMATERVDVTMAERIEPSAPRTARDLGIPTEEHHRDYGTSLHGSPHRPGGDLGAPDSHVSGEVRHIDVGGLTFEAPDGWTYEHPDSGMRRAQFGIPGPPGSAGLVVYFFGQRGAGSSQANFDRWTSQFKNADGSPLEPAKPIRREVSGLDVVQVEVAGTYVGGMGSGQGVDARPVQRMIATIVETPHGPFYFKLLGDDAVVASNREAFEALLGSMRLTEG